MTENQDQKAEGAEKAKGPGRMFAVLQGLTPGVAEVKTIVVEAHTRKELAQAVAAHPEMGLVLAVRGKRLEAKEKKTVSFQ